MRDRCRAAARALHGRLTLSRAWSPASMRQRTGCSALQRWLRRHVGLGQRREVMHLIPPVPQADIEATASIDGAGDGRRIHGHALTDKASNTSPEMARSGEVGALLRLARASAACSHCTGVQRAARSWHAASLPKLTVQHSQGPTDAARVADSWHCCSGVLDMMSNVLFILAIRNGQPGDRSSGLVGSFATCRPACLIRSVAPCCPTQVGAALAV